MENRLVKGLTAALLFSAVFLGSSSAIASSALTLRHELVSALRTDDRELVDPETPPELRELLHTARLIRQIHLSMVDGSRYHFEDSLAKLQSSQDTTYLTSTHFNSHLASIVSVTVEMGWSWGSQESLRELAAKLKKSKRQFNDYERLTLSYLTGRQNEVTSALGELRDRETSDEWSRFLLGLGSLLEYELTAEFQSLSKAIEYLDATKASDNLDCTRGSTMSDCVLIARVNFQLARAKFLLAQSGRAEIDSALSDAEAALARVDIDPVDHAMFWGAKMKLKSDLLYARAEAIRRREHPSDAAVEKLTDRAEQAYAIAAEYQ